MSNTAKTVTALVVLIIVIIIGWIWYSMSGSSNSNNTAPETSMEQSAGTQAIPPATPTAAANQTAPGMSSPSDSSDAGLNQDLNSVDSEMNGLNSDSSNIDNSLNTNNAPAAQ